jgi:hypothetical protein
MAKNKEERKMKAIQKNQGEGWVMMGPAYAGLTDDDAKKTLKQLRGWAKDLNGQIKYRVINVVLVPR